MTEETIAPEIEQALEERTEWINHCTELAAAGNWQAVQKAVQEIDEEHLRSVIYVLVLARAGDLNSLRALVLKQAEGDDAPVLH